MASVQSLGLHEPSALSYLIDEDALPKEPLHSSNTTWRTYPVYDDAGQEVTEDELLYTNNCVVWARGGIVKRAFNLDVEDEEIIQSFITRFPAWETGRVHQTATANTYDAKGQESSAQGEKSPRTPKSNEQASGQALIVILKTKAHIYFLTGDTHIVSIPF
jgi:anaphase-promoting complex subunit 1